jgi:hypothetical protein
VLIVDHMNLISAAWSARPHTLPKVNIHSDIGLFEQFSDIVPNCKPKRAFDDYSSLFVSRLDLMADSLRLIPVRRTLGEILEEV